MFVCVCVRACLNLFPEPPPKKKISLCLECETLLSQVRFTGEALAGLALGEVQLQRVGPILQVGFLDPPSPAPYQNFGVPDNLRGVPFWDRKTSLRRVPSRKMRKRHPRWVVEFQKRRDRSPSNCPLSQKRHTQVGTSR